MPKVAIERWALLAILLLTLALYSVLLDAPSLPWDDDSNIFANPYYRAQMWQVFWTDPYYGLYVPVISSCWQVLYTLGHGEVWPFRIFNSCLHVFNILLVYRLLRALAARWKISGNWPIYFGVMWFAWHPLQVESVAWISGGRDVLSATLALLCVIFYLRDESWKGFLFSSLFFAASLLSKPITAILPVVCLAADFLWRPSRVQRLSLRLLPWFGLSVWSIRMTTRAQIEHLTPVEWWLRPWIMGDAYAFYWRKMLWPWNLSANYARTPDFVLSHASTIWWAAAFALIWLGMTFWAWRREPRAFVLWIWALLLLPVSGLVSFGFQKISTTADHYNYLAMVPVAAFAMLLLSRASHLRRPLQVLSAVLLPIFLGLTGARVQVWTSTEAFFTDMARTAPKDYATAIGMSVVECHEHENYDRGVEWTQVALAARPHDISALANQAYCLLHAKNYFAVGAMESYLMRLELSELEAKQPTPYSSFLASLGTALMELRQYQDGFPYLCEAYRVKPAEPNHARNLEVAAQIMRQQGLDSRCPGVQ